MCFRHIVPPEPAYAVIERSSKELFEDIAKDVEANLNRHQNRNS